MEPAFQRGDILFLDNQPSRISVGEIVVYNVKGRDVPIVHRVLETHERCVVLLSCAAASQGTLPPLRPGEDVRYLTKGDNNSLDDRGLYAPGERWLSREEIIGRARMYVPCRWELRSTNAELHVSNSQRSALPRHGHYFAE